MKHLLEKLLVRILPRVIYRSLGGLYGQFIRPKKSFSQYGEDLIIKHFFKSLNIHHGVYVDIGAFHPRWLSNTHLLHLEGWAGSAVDIDQDKIRLFEKVRPRCLGFVGAVAPGQMTKEVTIYKFQRLWSEIDTLSLADAEKYKLSFGINYDLSKVQTISINEILNKTYQIYGKINFINIDIEGLDEAILFDMDFQRFKPNLICFENNSSFGGSKEVQDLLLRKGYHHLFSSGGTHGYFTKGIS
jgi:hypothetical protein